MIGSTWILRIIYWSLIYWMIFLLMRTTDFLIVTLHPHYWVLWTICITKTLHWTTPLMESTWIHRIIYWLMINIMLIYNLILTFITLPLITRSTLFLIIHTWNLITRFTFFITSSYWSMRMLRIRRTTDFLRVAD